MIKLVLQIVVAVTVFTTTRHFNWPWWGTAVVLVAGFVIVHVVWERVFFNPFVHLGAMPIANDDPLMLNALERARETWKDFLEIYPQHRQDSIVKFKMQNTDGEYENLWGDLLDLHGENASVYLRTPPVGEMDIDDRNLTVPIENIVDWQIEFTDGSLRGGFTQQAAFKIYAREEGHMPPQFQEQLARYHEL